jgi:hypothetical protein
MYSGDNYDSMGWAVLMAGGSLAVLPTLDKAFLANAASMKPVVDATAKTQWMLKGDDCYIIYSHEGTPVQLSFLKGEYSLRLIHPKTGAFIGDEATVNGSYGTEVKLRQQVGAVVIWLRAKQKEKQQDASSIQ